MRIIRLDSRGMHDGDDLDGLSPSCSPVRAAPRTEEERAEWDANVEEMLRRFDEAAARPRVVSTPEQRERRRAADLLRRVRLALQKAVDMALHFEYQEQHSPNFGFFRTGEAFRLGDAKRSALAGLALVRAGADAGCGTSAAFLAEHRELIELAEA
jgi:hypothetical protein